MPDGPLKGLLNRYLSDQRFHEHANKMMADPAYRKHVNRMNHDPQYAKEYQQRMKQQKKDQKAQSKQPKAPKQPPQPGQQPQQHDEQQSGQDDQQPTLPGLEQAGPAPVAQKPITVPNTSRKPFGNPGYQASEPFPEPPIPTFSDDENSPGNLKMSRRNHP